MAGTVGRPRKHSPRRRGNSAREEILDASSELFTTQGFATTSTHQIADAVGIRQASLYYHFPSKTEIFLTLLNSTIEPSLELADELAGTDADREAFEARTARLIAQYDSYCPLPEHCVNGALSIGENIGDLGGVSIALKAYRASLDGQPSPEIDGYTGTQRFFIGWAQVWARQHREEDMINRLKTGPHAPSEFRTNGVVRNIPDWYEAFAVKPDDALWLPPEERVRIW